MRILFVTSNRIGDAVLTTGLLDHLIRGHPDARITIACGPDAAGLFVAMPLLDRVIVFEKRRFGLHWVDLWRQVAPTFWDLVVDIRASALAFTVVARRRAVRRVRGGHKTVELASILRLDTPPLPVAWTSADDDAVASRLIPAGGPVIAVAPTANWIGKVWPPERYVALVRGLTASALVGARVAMFGGSGPAERVLAAPVLAALPDAIDLCGRLSLGEAAACLRRCALFIGNDSGLMHLAAATGIPTLGLFGPTPAEEYGPVGRMTAIARADGPGMETLPVDRARAAAEILLARATPLAA
jgi:ADP-heptose:LPS heptosyltransferase